MALIKAKRRISFNVILSQWICCLSFIVCVAGSPVYGSAIELTTGPVTFKVEGGGENAVDFWLESSLHRVYPATPPGDAKLHLLAPRNAKVAFQACFKNRRITTLAANCSLSGADDITSQVRYVEFVPIWHRTPDTETSEIEGAQYIPGLVPDPLWPLQSVVGVGPGESRSFWITLKIPPDAKPGHREVLVRLGVTGNDKATTELPLDLEISDFVVKPRKDFPVVHWWRGEAIWDYYKTKMFDERWWQITRWELEDMLDHGSDVVYVPIFFDRRETFRRPCQLLDVTEPQPGKYHFDWSRTRKFIAMCRSIGFRKFEWSHLWIYWGVKNPVRIYTKTGDESYRMLWSPDISGFSDTYVNFLKQFLPEFHDFLVEEKLLDDSYFHLSDEPGAEDVERYRHARQILHDLAPWMKTIDALSDIRYGKEGLTDMPIPLVAAAQAYIDAKIPHWVYYCCVPRGPYLNRFCDTPLSKIRMSGWTFYRLGAKGFLHWGFNYWHKMEREECVDPFTELAGGSYPGIPYGDPFVIYPGPDGKPLDSIRWEVFAESLQDFAILQTSDIKPGDPLLAEIHSYKDFPKDADWIERALQQVLARNPTR